MTLYPTSFAEEIEESLHALDLAIRLQIGFREGFITNSCFTKDMGINRDSGSYLKGIRGDSLFKNRFTNLVLITMGSASCAIDRALDGKFGKKDSKDNSEVGSLRNIFYMIRCAFAHDPCNPQWSCKDKYCEFPYVIMIDKKDSSRVVFKSHEIEKMKFELDFKKLNNQRLNTEHFNALDGFFLLAEHAKKQAS